MTKVAYSIGLLLLLLPRTAATQDPRRRLGQAGAGDPPSLPRARSDRHQQPARQRNPRRRVPEDESSSGRHSGQDLRARSQPRQSRRPHQGQRHQAAAADPGAHRRRRRAAREVAGRSVRRGAQGRLRLGPRHGDDKPVLAANLMVMLLLKRSGVALDRDVIFLAESGEEADATGVGINFMVQPALRRDRRRVRAHRRAGAPPRRRPRDPDVRSGPAEKVPRAGSAGRDGHLRARLGAAPGQPADCISRPPSAKIGAWETPMRLNETTRAYFGKLAAIAPRRRRRTLQRQLLERAARRPRSSATSPSTSRSTIRCCAPPSCRRSSRPASARTSSRRRRKPRSTSARCPMKTSRVSTPR